MAILILNIENLYQINAPTFQLDERHFRSNNPSVGENVGKIYLDIIVWKVSDGLIRVSLGIPYIGSHGPEHL